MLTKICVVVLSVLIILACALFTAQATTGPAFRKAYEQEQLKSKAREVTAKNEMVAHNVTRLQRDRAQAEAVRVAEESRMAVGKLNADLATANAKNASLQNSISTLSATLGALEVDAANFNKRNDQLAAQLADMRSEKDELNKEVIRLSELVKQVEAEKTRTEQLARVHQEDDPKPGRGS